MLSGPSSQFLQPAKSQGKLRKLARHGVALGAVSGGVFPLAQTGLLDGYTTSVHWCYEAGFVAAFPQLSVTENVIMIDRQRLTASGAAAAFDLALHLIQGALGADVATEVACWFQHPMMRGQGVTQRRPTFATESTVDMLPKPIRNAVEIFGQNIEDPVSISDVAEQVGVSSRQLERMFRSSTGTTPLRYYRSLRVNKARQLLLYSKDSIIEIAIAVGYSSASTLAKNYMQVFGVRPGDDRKKVN